MKLYVRISELNANRRYLKTSKMDVEIYRAQLKAQVMNGEDVDVNQYLGKCEIPRIKASLDILRLLGASDLTVLRAKKREYEELAYRYYGYINQEKKEIRTMQSSGIVIKAKDMFNRGVLAGTYGRCMKIAASEAKAIGEHIEIIEHSKKR